MLNHVHMLLLHRCLILFAQGWRHRNGRILFAEVQFQDSSRGCPNRMYDIDPLATKGHETDAVPITEKFQDNDSIANIVEKL